MNKFTLKTPIRYHLSYFGDYLISSRTKCFKYADLVLMTTSGPTFAHKLIVACFSRVLNALIDQFKGDIDVSLIDFDTPAFNYVRAPILEMLIDFLYTGKLDAHSSIMEEISALARNLGIDIFELYLTNPSAYTQKPYNNFLLWN